MKKTLLIAFSIFVCLVFSGCSDEFGCLSIAYSWGFYLPENKGSMYYETFDSDRSEIRNYPSDKEGYDLFVIRSGEELHTRRNYKETQKAHIEYVDGTWEDIEPGVEIPYLGDEREKITVVVPSEKYKDGIECFFSYQFDTVALQIPGQVIDFVHFHCLC